MTERECGGCTACCEGWLSDKSLNMRPYQPCVHCTKLGCAIYPNRPEKPCVQFKCGWLLRPDLFSEEMRPDRAGSILLLDRKWNFWDVIRAVPTGAKIPDATLSCCMEVASQEKIPLIFGEHQFKEGRFVGWKYKGYGPPAFVQAVKDEVNYDDIFRL